MHSSLISDSTGILAVLAGVAALFFFLDKHLQWRIFRYVPPLIFIYGTPVILSNTGIIPTSADVYGVIGSMMLPMILTLLLLRVDVKAAFGIMGKGVFVMLFGTLGVVIGGPLGYILVKHGLTPDAWKAFGTLAGSWIGGNGNMAAVAEMVEASGTEFGLAVLGDTVVALVWIPVLLLSKNLSGWFHRFNKVCDMRYEKMQEAAKEYHHDEKEVELYHYLYLFFLGFGVTWVADQVSGCLPVVQPYLSTSTWRVLLVTTMGLILSQTPARRIPGSFQLAMGLLYLFVARMGASADLSGVATQAPWFILGAFVWIAVHGLFCLLGARLFRVDIATAAIASAANIGGAATAPVVAAYHDESLVPASILMALIGYALGNYAGYLTAVLCASV